MIPQPTLTRIFLARGVTHMRKGLAAQSRCFVPDGIIWFLCLSVRAAVTLQSLLTLTSN